MKSQQEINELNKRRLELLAADILAEKKKKVSRKQASTDRQAKSKAKPK